MAKMREFEANDGSGTWFAFPKEIVQQLDADSSDPVVLVLDRKRAGALAVMALCHRNILGSLAGLVDAMGEVAGPDVDALGFTRQLGADMAHALDWDVEDDSHKILEQTS